MPRPDGRYLTDANGERRWYAYPERERCDGSGIIRCLCGGDLCVCANGGEIECAGCDRCDPDDYYDDFPEDDDREAPDA